MSLQLVLGVSRQPRVAAAGAAGLIWWQQNHAAIDPASDGAGGQIPPQEFLGGVSWPPKQSPQQCYVEVPPPKPNMPPKPDCEEGFSRYRAIVSTGRNILIRASGYATCITGYLACKKLFRGTDN